jgi:adenine C2-methylase RlmN of 23S rRNA A2503 and tRNA A37
MGHPRSMPATFQWCNKRAHGFPDMTEIGRLRGSLAEAFRVTTPEVMRRERSSDGTANS